MENMNSKREGDILTVCPQDRLDTKMSPVFQAEVESQLDGIMHLRIDMAGLNYISSAGLRVLMFLLQTMEDRKGDMELLHVNATITEVFDITGMLDVLTIK